MRFPGTWRRLPGLVFALTVTAPFAQAGWLNSIALEADGSIVVVDGETSSVVRIDRETGGLTTVSGNGVGSGLPLLRPFGIAVEADGSLLVTVPNEGHLDGQERLVRVNPVTGNRTSVSDAVTGTGPVLQAPADAAVAPDGSVFLIEGRIDQQRPGRILRVDPGTGDRAIVAVADAASGLANSSGLAVEASGTLVSTVESAVLRIDPATGTPAVVSDSTTGAGPAVEPYYNVAVGGGGTLAVTAGGRELFCTFFCPSDVCVICLMETPSVLSVNPTTGDRKRLSGGGLALETVGGILPLFGGRGGGPILVGGQDLAIESGLSLLVADEDRVVRVNRVTGRRTLLAEIDAPNASVEKAAALDRLRARVDRLSREDPRRIHRPAHPRAWLREALGRTAGSRTLKPRELLSRRSPAESGLIADRLYPAMWRAMRDVLGADHPDTLAAAPAAARE